VVLEDYECTLDDGRRFCELFRDVLQTIPADARAAIMAHWQTGGGSPHVWLLNDRKKWKGKGWAASTDLSVYMVSTLIGRLPEEHVRTAIAHELGHILFRAGGERIIALLDRSNR